MGEREFWESIGGVGLLAFDWFSLRSDCEGGGLPVRVKAELDRQPIAPDQPASPG